MEDGTVKVKKKNKTGPLKSTPGFLKCMRNVYLYFKEEKEKGALNIPINSFIERTAVACGVGRKTLYNYAKKGLFDEHPTILQPKQKKKKQRGKLKMKTHSSEDGQLSKRGRKKGSSPLQVSAGPSTSPILFKTKSPPPRIAKNAMIQTDSRPINASENICIQPSPGDGDSGFAHFMISRDQSKGQQIQVVQPSKITETTTHIIAGPWLSGAPAAIRRPDVDYFAKSAVYNMHATESQTCTTELKIATCQQQTASDHLADL